MPGNGKGPQTINTISRNEDQMGKSKKETHKMREYVAQLLAKRIDEQGKSEAQAGHMSFIGLEHSSGWEGRLDEFLTALGRKMVKDPLCGSQVEAVLKSMAEQLFDEERLEACLHVYFTTFKANIRTMALSGLATADDPKTWLGLGSLALQEAFLMTAGSCKERSIQFALFLLERMKNGLQAIANMGPGIKHFDPLSKEAYDYMIQQPSLKDFTGKDSILYAMVRESWNGPPGFGLARKWIDRLIEGLDDSDLVSEIFIALIRHLNLFVSIYHPNQSWTNQCAFRVIEQGQEAAYAAKRTAANLLAERSGIAMLQSWLEPLTCVVTADQHPKVVRWTKRCHDDKKKTVDQGQQVLEWLEHNRPRLEADLERKRKLIREQPKRGLRPNGSDHIDIEVSPLRNAGVRAIVFFPENRTFPDVRLELLMNQDNPHLIAISGELAELGLRQVQDGYAHGMTDIPAGQPSSLQYKFLLELATIDILYRIIVEGKELRSKKGPKHDERDDRPRNHPVRPHLRRLVNTQRASASAQQEAKRNMGWRLPPGMTFVTAHYRGDRLEYDYPTEPVGVYTDADLFEREEDIP